MQEIDIEVDHSGGGLLSPSDVATLWSLLEPLKDLSRLGAGAEAYGAESTKMETKQRRKRKAETGVGVGGNGSGPAKKKRFTDANK